MNGVEMRNTLYGIGLILSLNACSNKETASSPEKTNTSEQKTQTPLSKPDPLKGKSLAEVCSSDDLALIRWSFEDLQNGFANLCCANGGLEDGRCELDWPFSDVPGCDVYDDMRNGIFARYGYPFTKKEWQDRFEKTSWYKKRSDFKAEWLSEKATENVQKLKDLKKNRVGCSDQ